MCRYVWKHISANTFGYIYTNVDTYTYTYTIVSLVQHPVKMQFTTLVKSL